MIIPLSEESPLLNSILKEAKIEDWVITEFKGIAKKDNFYFDLVDLTNRSALKLFEDLPDNLPDVIKKYPDNYLESEKAYVINDKEHIDKFKEFLSEFEKNTKKKINYDVFNEKLSKYFSFLVDFDGKYTRQIRREKESYLKKE